MNYLFKTEIFISFLVIMYANFIFKKQHSSYLVEDKAY